MVLISFRLNIHGLLHKPLQDLDLQGNPIKQLRGLFFRKNRKLEIT